MKLAAFEGLYKGETNAALSLWDDQRQQKPGILSIHFFE